jgi:ferrous iron transport protein A
MMPIIFVNDGETATIAKISGKPEVKKHLENLGFVVGSNVLVVSQNNGNVIVKVKEARFAISKEMANKIFVQ